MKNITSYTFIIVIFFTLLLTACGGGKKGPTPPTPEPPPPPPLPNVGVFTGIPIEGMRYETDSTSGYTNANSEYNYFDGETITFSVGGIVIGSIAAADNISLLDLESASLPDNYESLEAVLLDFITTEFDVISNKLHFLFSLDIDGNPDNGIDITGWDAVLANETIDFNMEYRDFYWKQFSNEDDIYNIFFIEEGDEDIELHQMNEFERFAIKYNVNKNLPYGLPMSYLYSSLSIDIPVNAETGFSRYDYIADRQDYVNQRTYREDGYLIEVNSGRSSFQTETFNRDLLGRITNHIVEYDREGDGIIDSTLSYAYTYGDLWQVENITADYSYAGGGNSQESISITYNANGNILQAELNFNSEDSFTVTTDYTYGNNGEVLNKTAIVEEGSEISLFSETNTFDNNGNQTSYLYEGDYENDGTIDEALSLTVTYDSNNNQLTRTFETINQDGQVDYRDLTTNTYDSNNNRLSSIYDRDSTGNGVYTYRTITEQTFNSDNIRLTYNQEVQADGIGVATAIYSIVDSYNDEGVLTYHSEFTDNNADGVPIRYNYSIYDDNGNELTSYSESDSNNDGILDRSSGYERTYDANNNRLTSTYTEDRGADMVVDYTFTYTTTFDDQNNRLTENYTQDGESNGRSMADGVNDRESNTVFVYDSNGNNVSQSFEQDGIAGGMVDGTVDSSRISTLTYDANNNLLTRANLYDSNADGVDDRRDTVTYEYDSENNRLSQISEFDYNIDGTADTVSTRTFTYDDRNNTLTQFIQQVVDGVIDYTYSYTYEFDENNNQISSLTEIDQDGDGVLDTHTLAERSYSDFSNGVYFLFNITEFYGEEGF